jgi:hypothetical protein
MWLPKILPTQKSERLEKRTLLCTPEQIIFLFQKPFPFLQGVVAVKNTDRKIVFHLYDRKISVNESYVAERLWPHITFQMHYLPGKRERVYIGMTEGVLLKTHQVNRRQIQKWFNRLFVWLASRDFKYLGLEVTEKGLEDLSFYTQSPMNFKVTKRKYNKKGKLEAVMMQRVLPKRKAAGKIPPATI